MTTTTAEKIRILAKRTDKSMGDLADATGQSRQNLSNQLSRGNLSEKDIVALAEAMGCEVNIVFTLPDGSEL